MYEAFDGQRSGLLKPSQLAQRRIAHKRPTPPPDYRPTDWQGLTRKAFLWSRFSDEDRRLVLQTPRGRRRSVPTAEPKHRNDNFQAAFHKFQELGRPRAARGRARAPGSRPPPPALVPIWMSGGLNAARRSGSGESRTSSSGTPEGSPLRAAAVTPEQRSFRSDGSGPGSGSGSGCGSGSGSDHVFPMESPEPDRRCYRRLSSPGSLSRVCLVPAGPSSQETGSATVVQGPSVPRPASLPSHLPVSSTQRHRGGPVQSTTPERGQRNEADTPQSSEMDRSETDRSSSDLSKDSVPELQPPSPVPMQPAPARSTDCDPDKPGVEATSSPARPETGDIEIGLAGLEEPHSVGEDTDDHAEAESDGEDEGDPREDGDEHGPSTGEAAEKDEGGERGERPPPPPRRRVQVERHNSEVHLRLSRSSEQMIRQLETVQYEPGQTDDDGVELRKKKPKSFRRKLKEVLRRAKEDEALLQDFTEYLVVVRPDKMILKRVGDVAREEAPPPARAIRGRGGRHHGLRRPHTTSIGADDVFSLPRQTTGPPPNEATPPAMPWGDTDEEVPVSPRYAADGSPESTLSVASKDAGSEDGSSPPRESLVQFISRHSQRPKLEARRRCRQNQRRTAEEMEDNRGTVLPPPYASPGQSHDCKPATSEKLTPQGAQDSGKGVAQESGKLSVDGSDPDGDHTPSAASAAQLQSRAVPRLDPGGGASRGRVRRPPVHRERHPAASGRRPAERAAGSQSHQTA